MGWREGVGVRGGGGRERVGWREGGREGGSGVEGGGGREWGGGREGGSGVEEEREGSGGRVGGGEGFVYHYYRVQFSLFSTFGRSVLSLGT